MTIEQTILAKAVAPALDLLPRQMDTQQARTMLVAIGLQESALQMRYQLVKDKPGSKGPARGLWQFEQHGGVLGVMGHRQTEHLSRWLLFTRKTGTVVRRNVWVALEYDDVLAAGFARLLLWSDPSPLPAVGDMYEAWNAYMHIWRPGKPHRDAWARNYERAMRAVEGS